MSRWNANIKGQNAEANPRQPPNQRQGQQLGRGGGAPQGGRGGGSSKDMKDAIGGARELMKAKRFDEALKVYEAILEKHPEAVQAYIGIGSVHASRGEYDDALEYYAGALHIRKDLAPALVMSGNVYMRQGLFDNALEKYKEALEINPSLGNAQIGVARVYMKLGKFNEAIDCLSEALRHNPQLEEAHLALAGIYHRTGDIDAALKELAGVVARIPESSQAQLQYAKLLAARGEFKLAVSACKKAIEAKPDSAPMHNVLGGAYLGIGEYELALREYAKAIEIDPSLLIAKIGTARANMQRGNLADAKKVLVSMTKGTRHLGVVHRLLGDILMREGAYSDAVAEFQAAVLHSQRLVQLHPEFSSIQHVAGNDRKTAEAYQAVFAKIDVDSAVDLEVGSLANLGDDGDTHNERPI